ncbi:EF-hand calcium-binding domain-containing protein 11 isoform X3 [Alligator mississippiensis]|uniref:EF-hand calcium-binding domain-containing protein 11 isoform X3 n=1 Tax=Alligator mississippiensis TaxID=8496 RepID=UPI002877283B|nr:EF-hand calcium-binding domain-containing protein 11 isoform X3 [Alligator mississippiensis]
MCAASARAGDRERYARVFAACDEDSKGYLSREDFKVAVVMLFGYKPSKVEVNSVMASLQQKNSGVLLEEFLNLMTTKKSAQLYHSEIRQIFTAFDMQCRGFLTLEDFKKAFDSIAPKLPKRIIIEAFRNSNQHDTPVVYHMMDSVPCPKKTVANFTLTSARTG